MTNVINNINISPLYIRNFDHKITDLSSLKEATDEEAFNWGLNVSIKDIKSNHELTPMLSLLEEKIVRHSQHLNLSEKAKFSQLLLNFIGDELFNSSLEVNQFIVSLISKLNVDFYNKDEPLDGFLVEALKKLVEYLRTPGTFEIYCKVQIISRCLLKFGKCYNENSLYIAIMDGELEKVKDHFKHNINNIINNESLLSLAMDDRENHYVQTLELIKFLLESGYKFEENCYKPRLFIDCVINHFIDPAEVLLFRELLIKGGAEKEALDAYIVETCIKKFPDDQEFADKILLNILKIKTEEKNAPKTEKTSAEIPSLEINEKLRTDCQTLLSGTGFVQDVNEPFPGYILNPLYIGEVQGNKSLRDRVRNLDSNVFRPDVLQSQAFINPEIYRIFKIKFLAHALGLKGKEFGIHWEGFYEGFTIPRLVSNLRSLNPQNLSSPFTTDDIAWVADQLENAVLGEGKTKAEFDQIAQSIRNGGSNPIVLCGGWNWHALGVVFFGDYMIFCNKGDGKDGFTPIEIFEIPAESKKLINGDLIEKISNRLAYNKTGYQTMKDLVQLLGAISVHQENLANQKVGNCTYTTYKTVLRVLLSIRFMKNQNLVNRDSWKNALQNVNACYKEITKLDRKINVNHLLSDAEHLMRAPKTTPEYKNELDLHIIALAKIAKGFKFDTQTVQRHETKKLDQNTRQEILDCLRKLVELKQSL